MRARRKLEQGGGGREVMEKRQGIWVGNGRRRWRKARVGEMEDKEADTKSHLSMLDLVSAILLRLATRNP